MLTNRKTSAIIGERLVNGGIAQLARAFGSYPTGQWFKSVCSHQMWPHGLMVRTSPFHGGNMGSNPVGITNTKASPYGRFFVLVILTELKNPLGSEWIVGENKC